MTEELVEFDIDLNVEFDMDLVPIANALDVFYSREFFFSYSSLKLLLFNPPAFKKKYIDNTYEEKLDKHLVMGKLIHYIILESRARIIGGKIDKDLLLQGGDFNRLFVVSPLNVPSGNNLKLVNAVFKEYRSTHQPDEIAEFGDCTESILETLRNIDLWQALKDDKPKPGTTIETGDQKRLGKVLTDENKCYFSFLFTRGNKNVIDEVMLYNAMESAEVILNDQYLCDLMGIGKPRVHNEQLLFMPLDDYQFGLKGILDNTHIDDNNLKIFVNDFKTTSKELKEFPNAVKFFNYDIQAAIYMRLIRAHYGYLIDAGYTIEFRFITIDNNKQAYAFPASEATLEDWDSKLNQLLVEANFHYTNKSFNLPYLFETNQVVL